MILNTDISSLQSTWHYKVFSIKPIMFFTESAPRLIQYISQDVRLIWLFVCPICWQREPRGLDTSGQRAYLLNCNTMNCYLSWFWGFSGLKFVPVFRFLFWQEIRCLPCWGFFFFSGQYLVCIVQCSVQCEVSSVLSAMCSVQLVFWSVHGAF